MMVRLRGLYASLFAPLDARARIGIALLVVPLLLALWLPLWRISMEAPQYPHGLSLSIHSYTIEGGHDGADLKEINILNHYIGMRPLDRAALSDLDWLPFAIGALALLALRCAAVGNVRSQVDLFVVTSYFCAFAVGRFAYRLYTYGHDLSPEAPLKVAGFTPPLFGTKQVANFTTHSFPGLGTLCVLVFAVGMGALALNQLLRRRREARPPEAVHATPVPA
jgi:copper chaperone NosL